MNDRALVLEQNPLGNIFIEGWRNKDGSVRYYRVSGNGPPFSNTTGVKRYSVLRDIDETIHSYT